MAYLQSSYLVKAMVSHMLAGIGNFLNDLLPQLPLLLVLLIGFIWARRAGANETKAVAPRYVAWALLILLAEALGMTVVFAWWQTAVIVSEESLAQASALLVALRVVGSLIQAGAFLLLLRGIFGDTFWLRGKAGGCWLAAGGALLGLVVGVLLAIFFGDSIGAVLGVSTFEGERGYFVVFALIPLFGVVGALIGGFSTWLLTRK